MIQLGGKIRLRGPWNDSAIVLKVSENSARPAPLRRREAFIVTGQDLPEGFHSYVVTKERAGALDIDRVDKLLAIIPDEMSYLADGDIIRIQPKQKNIRALYRRNSPSNSFLVTERCNHYCLMCSQPPKNIDDSWLVDEIKEAIPLIDPSTKEIGFTGGEPTLLGDDFLDVLRLAKSYLPNTSIHILSNGRRFSDQKFAKAYANIEHPDMMVGIPLYSDISNIHDYVVQSDGAFDETVRGIINLKKERQAVEVRFVIHQQTYKRLPQFAQFIARNLTFVDHVALMGLEMMGFTKANLKDLWIDPWDYQDELYRATALLAGHGIHVSIYNHQLCVLDRRVWPFAQKSISDWKNEYMEECKGCAEMERCGGFFSSAMLRYSDHITPFSHTAYPSGVDAFPEME